METPIIHSFEDGNAVAEAVAKDLVAFVHTCIAETGNCLIALSGGSTPNALFTCLAKNEYRDALDWDKIFFIWVDERFVPYTDQNSNYGTARELLFSKLSGGMHYFPVPTQVGTVEEAAAHYEKEIQTVLEVCNKQRADLMLLGLGADGHTASLFPKSIVLEEKNHIVAPVKDGKQWERVTLTLPFIIATPHIWFTVVGENKKAALSRILQQAKNYSDEDWTKRIGKTLPAAVIPMDNVTFYIDYSATPEW